MRLVECRLAFDLAGLQGGSLCHIRASTRTHPPPRAAARSPSPPCRASAVPATGPCRCRRVCVSAREGTLTSRWRAGSAGGGARPWSASFFSPLFSLQDALAKLRARWPAAAMRADVVHTTARLYSVAARAEAGLAANGRKKAARQARRRPGEACGSARPALRERALRFRRVAAHRGLAQGFFSPRAAFFFPSSPCSPCRQQELANHVERVPCPRQL